MLDRNWYKKAHRRNVIDMHITDHSPEYLSQFDTGVYLDMLEKGRADSAVVYAVSHVGLCNYPSKAGEMHKNLNGRDILREIIEGCHKKNIAVVVYYSVIHNSWAYDKFPDWRIIEHNGRESSEYSRYGYCCPNTGYRDFVVAQIKELCDSYEFEGMRFDMTFWPRVCYCPVCSKKFAAEVGGGIPKTVNWNDKRWVAFQRKREEWLNDFANLCTSTVKKYKPDASVEHQASTIHQPWGNGVNADLALYNDFLQGDFYGDSLQGSFACKLFYSLTPNKPFGFETSSSIQLWDHTKIKSEELLTAKVFASIANGGAFVFIDAIDPTGTLNPRVYERMNRVFDNISEYEQYTGGEMVQDVAVFLSTESKFDYADNGKSVCDVRQKAPHIDSAVNAVSALIKNNIPFGIITRMSLDELNKYKILILPNILMMSTAEIEKIKEYVFNGGRIYASKHTSLHTTDGMDIGNFMLSDVFGVDYKSFNNSRISYLGPINGGFKKIFEDYDMQYPLSVYDGQVLVKSKPGAISYAKTVLPYTCTEDPWNYSSIHSNPPGRQTEFDGVVVNKFGKGISVYVSGDLERLDFHEKEFMQLIGLLDFDSYSFKSNAPHCIEITMFDQKDKNRYILNILNFQKDLPGIPVNNVDVSVRTLNRQIKSVEILPSHLMLDFNTESDGFITFKVPEIKMFTMICIQFI